MKKTLERTIEAAVVRWAKAQGIESLKLNTMGRRSMPDRLFWLNGGRPLLIEFKRPGKRPTKLQAYTMKKLKGLGYAVVWCDSAEEAIEYIYAMDAKTKASSRRKVPARTRSRRAVGHARLR